MFWLFLSVALRLIVAQRRCWKVGALVLLFAPRLSDAQAVNNFSRVRGTVIDAASGKPVANANVRVLGSKSVAVTGADGRFAITDGPIGLYNIEARLAEAGSGIVDNINLRSEVERDVTIKISRSTLQGGGLISSATPSPISSRKSPFSVDRVNAEEMPVQSPLSAIASLDGKVAGLAIQRAGGSPGADLSIQLRTPITPTDTASVPPLLVVDGVLMSQTYPMSAQDIEGLDVEHIEIMKGVAAASLYGFRGMNGVIVVTTKRGRGLPVGPIQFSLRNEVGTDKKTGDVYDPLRAHQFRVNAAGQYVNALGAVVSRENRIVSATGIIENPYIVPIYDEDDALFRVAWLSTQTLTVQQNRAATNFSLAYSRTQQQAVVRDADGLQRHTVRFNLDQRVGNRLTVGLSASRVESHEEPFKSSFTPFNPDVNLLAADPDGKSAYRLNPEPLDPTRPNPLAQQTLNIDGIRHQRTLINLSLSERAFSWLTLDAIGSYDRGYRDRIGESGVALTLAIPGRIVQSPQRATDSIAFGQFQGGATAVKSIGNLTARVGMRGETSREAFQYLRSSSTKIFKTGAPNTIFDTISFSTSTYAIGERRVAAGFATLNLDYAGRYIADVALRREGLSSTGTRQQWNSFLRGSAAWLLNEEAWLPFGSLDLLKVRFSTGTGQEHSRPANPFWILVGPRPADPLPHIVSEYDAGFDMIVKKRLRVSASYASTHSREDQSGINATFGNIFFYPTGLKGRTIEGSIQASILNNPEGPLWDIALVGDHRENTISQFDLVCYYAALRSNCKGARTGDLYGYTLLRSKSELPQLVSNSLDQFDINDEGYVVAVGTGNTWRDGKAKNLWGTNLTINGNFYRWGWPIRKTDNFDLPIYSKIGNGNPGLRYGLQNTLRFKGFRLYGQVTGQLGGDVYNGVKQNLYSIGLHNDLDQSGKPDEQRKPLLYYRAFTINDSWYLKEFMESATYARLSEASLSYQFGANRFAFVRRIGAQRIEVDLVGRNLFTLTGYSGLNPQSDAYSNYVDTQRYPLTRTFSLATSIVF
ncbi:MAG: carboxypeptidase regulatory-like domain-containing protein [Gemmatimonas sp.]